MEICYLSKEFYEKYKNCKEILNKEDRPYSVLIVESCGKKFAIPFRSHVNQNNKDCYITDEKIRAGLDFQKSVILNEELFVDKTKRPEIRNIDYQAIHFKDEEILKAFEKYLSYYRKEILRNQRNPNIRLNARVQFSSLQYFHKELNLLKPIL
ncbi:MAG: hypothetical protein KBT11_07040 [Treponema sp.]|nr:hypothetical protein [Candidatus Treponema equifaecale]